MFLFHASSKFIHSSGHEAMAVAGIEVVGTQWRKHEQLGRYMYIPYYNHEQYM